MIAEKPHAFGGYTCRSDPKTTVRLARHRLLATSMRMPFLPIASGARAIVVRIAAG